MPCHTTSTSLSWASASAPTLGKRLSHSSQRPSTRETWVCWSMTSLIHIAYGSLVSRQGRLR